MKKLFYVLIFFLFINITNLNAEWVQTNGPYGGEINCLVTLGENLFAGTNNGVLLTKDNGAS